MDIMLRKRAITVWKTFAILVDLSCRAKSLPFALLYGKSLTQEVTFTQDGKTIIADIHRPADDKRHPALLMGHGMLPIGKNDPRVKNICTTLARAGYVVMVPQLEGQIRDLLTQEDVDTLVASFQYLNNQPFVKRESMGMGGFCISASLALSAAEDPSISDSVAVVSVWGGYYHIRDLVHDVVTETNTYNGRVTPWKPAPNVRPVIEHNLVNSLAHSRDRELLKEYLKERDQGDKGLAEELKEELSPEGQAVYDLLMNQDPQGTSKLWKVLNPQALENFSRVSPGTHIDRVKAKVLLIHGRGDGTVPSVESYKIANALKDRGRVNLTIFTMFDHVNPELSRMNLSNLRGMAEDGLKFFIYIYRLLYEL